MKRTIMVFVLVAAVVMAAAAFAGGNQAGTSSLNKDNQKWMSKLKSDDVSKRVEAATKLGLNKAKDAVSGLVDMMKNDKDFRARIVAANALCKIGDLSVIKDIKEQAAAEKNKTARTAIAGVVKEMEKDTVAEL
jgi:ribosomal protein L7/L12